jgi:hypothetical protein
MLAITSNCPPQLTQRSISIANTRLSPPLVMPSGKLDALIMDIVFDMRACPDNNALLAREFETLLQEFRWEWRRLWLLYGQSEAGWEH